MAIDFNDNGVDGDRVALGAAYPVSATGSSDGINRVEPLLTVDKLKFRFLKGISLVSPVTKEKITDNEFKDYINRAVSQVEIELGMVITPTQFTHRLPFDRNLYESWCHLEIPQKPIQRVQKLVIQGADLQTLYTIPPRWIETGHFQKGIINIVPLSPAFSAVSFTSSVSGNGVAFLTFIGQLGWIPAYWTIEYVAGFCEDKVPLFINELIGVQAALDTLSQLAAMNAKNTGYSIGIDAMSQSVNTPGPGIFQIRVGELMEKKKTLLHRIKKMYGNGILISNI